jgi:hypothetical protein
MQEQESKARQRGGEGRGVVLPERTALEVEMAASPLPPRAIISLLLLASL